jgi:hypothetical protein
MSLTSALFRAARVSATGKAVRKGKVGKRAVNIAKGRALGGSGFSKK